MCVCVWFLGYKLNINYQHNWTFVNDRRGILAFYKFVEERIDFVRVKESAIITHKVTNKIIVPYVTLDGRHLSNTVELHIDYRGGQHSRRALNIVRQCS